MKKFLVMFFAIVIAFPIATFGCIGEAENFGSYSDSEMEEADVHRITKTMVKGSEVIENTIIEEAANTAVYKKTEPAVAERCSVYVETEKMIDPETRKETSATIFGNVSNIMVEDVSSVVKKPNLIGDFYLTEKNDSALEAKKRFGSMWGNLCPVIKTIVFVDTISTQSYFS